AGGAGSPVLRPLWHHRQHRFSWRSVPHACGPRVRGQQGGGGALHTLRCTRPGAQVHPHHGRMPRVCGHAP
ncbi:hypothetical protein HaLaN_23402, partial [Haematococcus lacustris]